MGKTRIVAKAVLGSIVFPLTMMVAGMLLALAGGIGGWPTINGWGRGLAGLGSLALVLSLVMGRLLHALANLHRYSDEPPAGEDKMNSEGKKDA